MLSSHKQTKNMLGGGVNSIMYFLKSFHNHLFSVHVAPISGFRYLQMGATHLY